MIKKFVLIAVMLLASSVSFAETIHLKSGQSIQGRIIERTDRFIKIEFKGMPVTCLIDDIESIDGKKFSPLYQEKTVQDDSLNIQATDIEHKSENYNYINREHGFRLWYPPSWNLCDIYTNRELFEASKNDLVSPFSGEPACIIFIPSYEGTKGLVAVCVKKTSLGDSSAKQILRLVKKEFDHTALPRFLNYLLGKFKIVERPNIIDIEGRSFVRCRYIVDPKMRNVVYYIADKDNLYTISVISNDEDFDSYDPDFQEIIKSFTMF